MSTPVLALVAAQKKAATEIYKPEKQLDLTNRLAISPAEFAQSCGRQKVWAYRQIYRGRIRVIRDTGRLMIPISEVRRFVSDPVVYDGIVPPAAKSK